MRLSGWGRYPFLLCNGHTFESETQVSHLLQQESDWIAHGQGKSYGDSALSPDVLLTHRFNKLLDFDSLLGIVTCESGVLLAELIDLFLPKGWFLKITPGTKLISVGGAIASDVHGKNHHSKGCFSDSVISFRLMLSDGRIVHCSRTENSELFHATCGGMGLTGLILDATLQLVAVQSAYIREEIIPCRHLDEIFNQFEKYKSAPYSVAWIDCMAKGNQMGRSILMLGDHDTDGDLTPPNSLRLSVPEKFPSFLLNRFSITAFNSLYYHFKGRSVTNHRVSIETFFYPLDKIKSWNLMYGKAGFTEYQCVLPKSESFRGIRSLLKNIAASGIGSFFAALKLFGPQNQNYLSFPMEGYTLALDFKIQPKLFTLLDRLDEIVLTHGGRLYLAKDTRMPRDVFVQSYPMLDKFRAVRKKYGLGKRFNSIQSRRLGI